MRRHLVLAAACAGLLIVSGCGSDSGAKRTVTAVVTASGGAEAAASAESGAAESGAEGSGAATPGPDASGSAAASAASGEASGSASGSPSAAASTTAVSPAPIVVVDPLKVDCASILSAADVKKILNADIPNDRLKITVGELNADIGQTGRVRCLYGLSADKKSGQITIALTTYNDPAAAQKQVDVTVANETDSNAQVTPVTVAGYPATIALRDGGLIIMSYDNWTMAIAAPATVDPATLTAALPQLAEAALARVLKG